MYSYLNKKFGLKSLILEHAASLILAIKKFAQQDHEIQLFGKILRNEIDEDFHQVQVHIQETILQLLRLFLREKQPHKSEKDIQKWLEDVQGDKINLEDQFWIKVIERMYDSEDYKKVKGLVRESAQLVSN